MLSFDGTIHLSDVLLFGGGILAFGRVWLKIRDDVKDNSKDILQIGKTVDRHELTLEAHGEALHRMGWKRKMVNPGLDAENIG